MLQLFIRQAILEEYCLGLPPSRQASLIVRSFPINRT